MWQASEMRVNFVVMRLPDLSEEGGEGQSRGARRVPELQYFKRRSEYMKVKSANDHKLKGTTSLSCGLELS